MRFISCGNRHEKSGNEQFLVELSKWVFHERGHLKVSQQAVRCSLENLLRGLWFKRKKKKGLKMD